MISNPVERIITIHIERLPEGVYLAMSDDVQGLVAQGGTVTETIEIARDVARNKREAQAEGKEMIYQAAQDTNFRTMICSGLLGPNSGPCNDQTSCPPARILNGCPMYYLPNHPGDIPEGAVRAILRQAGIGIDADEFIGA